jgi:hypothetical protein
MCLRRYGFGLAIFGTSILFLGLLGYYALQWMMLSAGRSPGLWFANTCLIVMAAGWLSVVLGSAGLGLVIEPHAGLRLGVMLVLSGGLGMFLVPINVHVASGSWFFPISAAFVCGAILTLENATRAAFRFFRHAR